MRSEGGAAGPAALHCRVLAVFFSVLVGVILLCCLGCAGRSKGSEGEIAFVRSEAPQNEVRGIVENQYRVFVIAPSGKGERQLTEPPSAEYGGAWSDRWPDWAPDGSRILFTRCAYGGDVCETWTIQPDGTGPVRLGSACTAIPPDCEDRRDASWSPGGKLVAFRRNWGGSIYNHIPQFSELYVIDREGRHPRRLTRFAKTTPPYSGETAEPTWSPDGRRLAFTRQLFIGEATGKSAIFVIGANARGLRRVTPWQLGGMGPVDWSPNSRWILFGAEDFEPDEDSGLYVVHPDGSGLRRLTDFAPASILDASFSPDGSWILFHSQHSEPDEGSALYVVRPDGSGLHRLTHFTSVTAVLDRSFSPDGRWILFASGDTSASQIYLVHPDGSGLRQLTHFPAGTPASAPAFSPDGKWIIFSEGNDFSEPDPTKADGDIFVMQNDGTHVRAITSTRAIEDDLDWGPGH
jgi:Tol biopolymer transport system component